MFMVAAAVCENSMDAVVPDPFERATGIMIFDNECKDDVAPVYVTENFAEAIIEAQCEVLFCGIIYDKDFFEKIADAGVTRYNAAGMTVREAIPAMDHYELAIIRDYFGSPGHTHDHHHEPDCDGDCDNCELVCDEQAQS